MMISSSAGTRLAKARVELDDQARHMRENGIEPGLWIPFREAVDEFNLACLEVSKELVDQGMHNIDGGAE